MTADRARGALAVLQDADGKFICEVPCGYIVEQKARAHKPRRIQAQRRRRAMLRRRVALTVALLTVAALLAALMPWSGKRVAKRRFFKADERFATKAVIVIAITTAAFIVAQYVSFLVTRQEQTVLIEWYFRAVVIECGAMMMKRLAEVIVGRIKKKEKIDITESEDTNNDY